MDTVSIVVVGLGWIGLQHFEALTKLTIPARILCINRSPEALDKARELFQRVSNPNIVSVEYSTELGSAYEEIDLAVITISSLPRRETIETLLRHSRVRYMLLEKVLFPRAEDYAAVSDLLEANHVKAYVNCQRRMFPNYIALRERLRGEEIRGAYITGSRWGLGCNSIHFLDMLDFLIGSEEVSITCQGELLDNALLESKRKGYVEFTGRLIGRLDNQADFVFDSALTGENPITITIYTKTGVVTICESKRLLSLCDNEKGTLTREEFPMPGQSVPTNAIAEALLLTGECPMIPYERSAKLHLAILAAFVNKQKQITGEDSELCKIT